LIKILLLLFLSISIFADNASLASNIINTIAANITNKKNPKIFIYKKPLPYEIDTKVLNLVSNCDDADIILVKSTIDLSKSCSKKFIFGTRYSSLEYIDVIGAFFWQKGRPNILFYKSRLNEKHILLDDSFSKYIE